MAAAKEQMTLEENNLRSLSGMSHEQYNNLLESLKGERKGFYPQHLSMNEYDEYVRRSTDLATIARATTMENNDKEGGSVNE